MKNICNLRTISDTSKMLSLEFSVLLYFPPGDGLAEASGSRSNSSLIDPDEMLQAVESDESL